MTTRHACFTAEHLVDYHSDRLRADEERLVEDHLATCKDCTELSRHVYRLSRAWDETLSPDAAWKTAPVEAGSSWLQRFIGTLQGAALVVLSGPKLVVQARADAVHAAAPPLSRANIDALLVGRPFWPIPALQLSRGDAPEEAVSDATTNGRLTIDVDQTKRTIVVRVDGFPLAPAPLPAVTLIRKNGRERAAEWTVADSTSSGAPLAAFGGTEPPPPLRNLRAEFRIDEDDEYLVAVLQAT